MYRESINDVQFRENLPYDESISYEATTEPQNSNVKAALGGDLVYDTKRMFTNKTPFESTVLVSFDGTLDFEIEITRKLPVSVTVDLDLKIYAKYYNEDDSLISSNTLFSLVDSRTTSVNETWTLPQQTVNGSSTDVLPREGYVEIYAELLVTADDVNGLYSLDSDLEFRFLEKTEKSPNSNNDGYLAYEAVNNTLKIITGVNNDLYSPVLGRTDLDTPAMAI